MTPADAERQVWAIVTAATAGDHNGLEVLVDDLDLDDARDLLVGLATVTAAAISHHADRNQVLALLRADLLDTEQRST
ncbi:hypothetical protein HUO13_02485 [Saccharopolyspora erythraea]|uniref:hypothetical protein n=1 Tax=Saccharopolyspora erythraea TaxID=1836 RepID=UPI001BAA7FBD|nr:hypothetical protein [Saccharopolyspora erythraea]QUG99818.1 hypothetical protein HUO13_02485 [Saccharopolyspora erythraea]